MIEFVEMIESIESGECVHNSRVGWWVEWEWGEGVRLFCNFHKVGTKWHL